MQFFNAERSFPSTQVKAVILTVSFLLGLNTAVMVMAAAMGVVLTALLYVHALYLCFGFLKAILNSLMSYLLERVVLMFVSCRPENLIVEPVTATVAVPEPVPVFRLSHVQGVTEIAVVEPASLETSLPEPVFPLPFPHAQENPMEIASPDSVTVVPASESVSVFCSSHVQVIVAEESASVPTVSSESVPVLRLSHIQEIIEEIAMVEPVSSEKPLPEPRDITFEELAALDPAIIADSVSEPVRFILPSHIQESVNMDEPNEKAFPSSHTIQLNECADLASAVMYGPAPKPENHNESLAIVPVVPFYPLPQPNWFFVSVVEVSPLYFDYWNVIRSPEGGLAPYSVVPSYEQVLPLALCSPTPLLVEERAESVDDSKEGSRLEEAVKSSSPSPKEKSPVGEKALKGNSRPSTASAFCGFDYIKKQLSPMLKKGTAPKAVQSQEVRARSRNGSSESISSQLHSVSSSSQGSRSPSAERVCREKCPKGRTNAAGNAPSAKKDKQRKVETPLEKKKRNARTFYNLRHKK